jgi:uncharacterized protein YdaU (DUF1376 family)
MAKDPAFLMYSNNWLQGTSEFTKEEKGIYIDLLCHQHQDKGLPNDTKKLARKVGMSESEFLPHWDILKVKFNLIGDKYFNEKLKQVVNDRADYSVMRKILGFFGASLKRTKMSEKNKQFVKEHFEYKLYIEEFKLNEANCKQKIVKMLTEMEAKYINVNINYNSSNDSGIIDRVVLIDAWKKNIESDRHLSETACMANYIDSKQYMFAVDIFFNQKKAALEDLKWESESDCRRNLMNWLPKYIGGEKIETKQKSTVYRPATD